MENYQKNNNEKFFNLNRIKNHPSIQKNKSSSHNFNSSSNNTILVNNNSKNFELKFPELGNSKTIYNHSKNTLKSVKENDFNNQNEIKGQSSSLKNKSAKIYRGNINNNTIDYNNIPSSYIKEKQKNIPAQTTIINNFNLNNTYNNINFLKNSINDKEISENNHHKNLSHNFIQDIGNKSNYANFHRKVNSNLNQNQLLNSNLNTNNNLHSNTGNFKNNLKNSFNDLKSNELINNPFSNSANSSIYKSVKSNNNAFRKGSNNTNKNENAYVNNNSLSISNLLFSNPMNPQIQHVLKEKRQDISKQENLSEELKLNSPFIKNYGHNVDIENHLLNSLNNFKLNSSKNNSKNMNSTSSHDFNRIENLKQVSFIFYKNFC